MHAIARLVLDPLIVNIQISRVKMGRMAPRYVFRQTAWPQLLALLVIHAFYVWPNTLQAVLTVAWLGSPSRTVCAQMHLLFGFALFYLRGIAPARCEDFRYLSRRDSLGADADHLGGNRDPLAGSGDPLD